MRRLFIGFVFAVLSFDLAGCAVVDLAAYTVKTVQKNQRDGGSQEASVPPAASRLASANPAPEPAEAPLPQSAPLPRRSSVTVEELPR